MKSLTKFSLKRPVTMVLSLITILYFGLQAVFSSPVELTPEMNMPIHLIMTTYAGAAPEDIDELISKPIEDSLSTLSGLDTITSMSMENASVVMIQYNYGTNMDTAYMNLKKNLDTLKSSLPDDAKEPTIYEMDMNAMAVMQIAVSGGTDGNLYNYVDQNIVPELEKISSVGEVSITGGQQEYIKIEPIPEKLKQYGLDISTLTSLVKAADFTVPAGTTNYGDLELSVSVGSDYKDLEKIKAIVIPVKGGVVHLSEVANVYTATSKKSSIARYNGEDVVMISIQKQQSSSAVDVSNAVTKELSKLEQANPTLTTFTIYDSSEKIVSSIKNVFETLIIAIILSMIVLFLFFGDVKASLIVGSSIPISVLMALVGMGAMGFSLNMISLGALVLGVGMIVDNSIVVIESCFRKKEDGTNYYDTALEGTNIVLASIIGSTATTCVVFLPLALLSGLSGQLFKQLGFTIVFCMLASLLSACMIVPLLYFFLHPIEKKTAPVGKLMKSLQEGYRGLVAKILPHKIGVVVVSVLLLIGSLALAGNLGMELMSSVDEGMVSITIQTKPGLNIEAEDEIIKNAEAIIAEDSDVKEYSVSAGGSGISSLSSSGTTLTAYLKDKIEYTTDEKVSQWQQVMDNIPNCTITVESASSYGMSSMNTSQIEIDLQSTDYELLKSTTDNIVEQIRTQSYVTKVHSSIENAAPILKVDIDPVKAQAEGITPASVGQSLYSALSGTEVDKYTVAGKEYTVKLELSDDSYDTIGKLENYLITTPYGTQVALKDIAEVRFEDSPNTIERRDKRYQVAITAYPVIGYEKTADSSLKAYVDTIDLPNGVEYASSRMDEMMGEEIGALFSAVLTAVFLIFIVMAIQFESPKFSLMVMFTIPFSLVGAFTLLFIADCKISMVSMLGFLMMIGTVVNNGILYVDTVNQLKVDMPLDSALIEAGAIRMRPIFMTTLTTVISMVPMCLAYGDSGEMLQGLALVNVGGLIASTTLALLLLPTFYKIVDGFGKKRSEEYAGLNVD